MKEDELLLQCKEEYEEDHGGKIKWTEVGKMMAMKGGPLRNDKQCRDRYKDHFMPGLVKGNWTDVEKKDILQMHARGLT